MSTLREQLAADMAEAISSYEQTFEWRGKTYPCVRRDLSSGVQWLEGGNINGISYTLIVAKAAFIGAFPKVDDLINENVGQIKQIAGDEDASAVQLHLTIGSPDV